MSLKPRRIDVASTLLRLCLKAVSPLGVHQLEKLPCLASIVDIDFNIMDLGLTAS